MSIVTTYNIGKSFDPVDIFAGLSLTIPHGARIALVGPNGIGKTTLIKAILNLISYKGEIECDLDIAYMPEKMVLPKHLKVQTYLKLMLPITVYSDMERLIDLLDMKDHYFENQDMEYLFDECLL